MLFYEILVIIVIVLCFLCSIPTLMRIKKTERKNFYLAWGIFYILFGVSRLFYFIQDFINQDIIFWRIAAIVGTLSLASVFYSIEKYHLTRSRFAFTTTTIVISMIFLIPFTTAVHEAIQTWVLPFLAPIIPILYLYVAIKSTGELRKIIITFLIAIILFALGNGAHSRIFKSIEWIYFIGSPILFTLSLIIMLYIIVKQFFELEWPKKIHHLYIFNSRSSITIQSHSFVEEVTEEGLLESQLITGGIYGIAAIIKKITKSKRRLRLLDHEDVKIILEYGSYITAALLTEENFGILRRKLKTLVQEFEMQFKDALVDFTGSLTEFENANRLIEQIFSFEDIEYLV